MNSKELARVCGERRFEITSRMLEARAEGESWRKLARNLRLTHPRRPQPWESLAAECELMAATVEDVSYLEKQLADLNEHELQEGMRLFLEEVTNGESNEPEPYA